MTDKQKLLCSVKNKRTGIVAYQLPENNGLVFVSSQVREIKVNKYRPIVTSLVLWACVSLLC